MTSSNVRLLRPHALPQESVVAPPLPLARAPLVDELRGGLGAALAEVLREFFASAQDALARQVKREALELAGWLNMEQARLARALAHDLGRRLAAAEVADRPRAGPSIEEAIALANLEMRLEAVHLTQAEDVARRLGRCQSEMAVQLNPAALSAAGLTAWLQAVVEGTDLPAGLRCKLYELFDCFAVAPIARLYQAALDILSRHGGTLPQSTPAPAMEVRTPREPLDPATLKLLRALARPQGSVYDDGALAQDLLAIAAGRAPAGFQAAQLWRPLHHMVLAARMLNDFLSDPYLPSALKPLFEALRFPLIKAVLTDASFFANTTHPLRTLLNDLAQMGVLARLAGRPALQQTVQLLQQVREQFDLNPLFVRNALGEATVLADDGAHGFVEQQHAQARHRRDSMVLKARRAVADELELRTLGRELTPPLQEFVSQSWAPLMTKRLLRFGLDAAPWRSALVRLDQVLDTLSGRAGAVLAADYAALVDLICSELAEEGFGDHKAADARRGLQAAWQAPPQVAAAPGAPPSVRPAGIPPEFTTTIEMPRVRTPTPDLDANAPLATILTPGSWFRVSDPTRKISRWLKLAAHYPRRDSVVFNEFDGEQTLQMTATQLGDDLAQGRSEPVNPTPEVRRALGELIAARSSRKAAR